MTTEVQTTETQSPKFDTMAEVVAHYTPQLDAARKDLEYFLEALKKLEKPDPADKKASSETPLDAKKAQEKFRADVQQIVENDGTLLYKLIALKGAISNRINVVGQLPENISDAIGGTEEARRYTEYANPNPFAIHQKFFEEIDALHQTLHSSVLEAIAKLDTNIALKEHEDKMIGSQIPFEHSNQGPPKDWAAETEAPKWTADPKNFMERCGDFISTTRVNNGLPSR